MVTLVATKGTGSMDLYRQKLCQHLNTCSIHLSFPEPFGTPLLSAQAVKFLIHSYETLKTLSQYKILHLANHRLARLAIFLKKYLHTNCSRLDKAF